MSKKCLVIGAGGFIGTHLVNKLKEQGHWVRGLDLKYPEFSKTTADEFIIGDATIPELVNKVMFAPGQESLDDKVNSFDEVYQLAALMGGAGFIFTGENDADVMYNSGIINFNVAKSAARNHIKKLFFSSSACIYPAFNQTDPNNPKCSEDSAYPCLPDSDYGWEKIISERLYQAFARNYGLNVRIGRFHNIFGTLSTYQGGKEKSPAALCRKVSECEEGGQIDVWGTGLQTRSFLYIDECIEGVLRLMDSDFNEPVNIGSEEMISINAFADMIIGISGKSITVKNILEGKPIGVMGRNSDNKLIQEKLGWKPSLPLKDGIEKTYAWINEQVNNKHVG